MMLLNFPLEQAQLFIFVLLRVTAILFSIPFFDSQSIPSLVKISIALAVSLFILPHLPPVRQPLTDNLVLFTMGVVSEVALGLIIGMTVQLLFAGVQLAGQMAGLQMGIAIANVMDPASSLQIPVLAQFLNLFAMILFLAFNVHFYFIRALMDAFELIPPLGIHFSARLYPLIMDLAANIFVVAVKVGAPVIIGLLLTSVALGLIARTVPQMQIFMVAMPLKIFIGLAFLGLSLPFCTIFMEKAFHSLGLLIRGLVRLFVE